MRDLVGGPPGGFAGLLDGDPVAEASENLTADEVRQAWDEGRRMTLEEAVALAGRDSPSAD